MGRFRPNRFADEGISSSQPFSKSWRFCENQDATQPRHCLPRGQIAAFVLAADPSPFQSVASAQLPGVQWLVDLVLGPGAPVDQFSTVPITTMGPSTPTVTRNRLGKELDSYYDTFIGLWHCTSSATSPPTASHFLLREK